MGAAESDQSYLEELATWRAALDDSLRRENSWLALAGLIWLESGSTPFGSQADHPICLDPEKAPPLAGEFLMTGGGVELLSHPGGGVLVDGEELARVSLRPDTTGDPQTITLGSYAMMLIERGGRLGIRLWDNARVERKMFAGRSWFPVDPDYRVDAELIPYEPEKKLAIPNELGEVEEETTPGYLSFKLQGKSLRLDTLEGPDGGFFLIFKDASAGDKTYGSGRFLITPAPRDRQVDLDFNRAYNPPCAFTEFATCPLPPASNILDIHIEAGEKMPPGVRKVRERRSAE